jgi:hypothetical protein
MHVREHCGNGASFGGRRGSPGCRIKVFNESLIHAVIGGKSFSGGRAESLFDGDAAS